MRQALSTVLTPRAISIQLHMQAHGIRVATINDSDLLRSADFVLAVRAQIPQEQLRRQFVQQTKSPHLRKYAIWSVSNCPASRWWHCPPHRASSLTTRDTPTSCWICKALYGKKSSKAMRLPSTSRVISLIWTCNSGQSGAANENRCCD